jgi:alpha-galactosidase
MSQDVKIVAIGAGSYVFGPGVLEGIIRTHRLPGIELALVDIDADTLAGMAGVAERMGREVGSDIRIHSHTDIAEALEGADFVLCAAAIDLRARFATDCEIIARHDPTHVITEFGGVAGLAYSARQIAFMRSIAEQMKSRCPDAWFLTVSNPLPRTCQAMHELGIRTAGFCSAAMEGYAMLWRAFEDEEIRFPFTAARERWDVTMGGLNHFSWVHRLIDRKSGRDDLPELIRRLDAGATTGWPNSDRISRQVGALLVPNDHHTQDFLPRRENAVNRGHASHGGASQRRERIDTLRAVASGELPLETVTDRTSWEKPVDMIAGLLGASEVSYDALNLVNAGQVPQLPRGVFVEASAHVTPEGPQPEKLEFPEAVLAYLKPSADQHDAIVKACLARSRAALLECLADEPTVTDTDACRAALSECLDAHADLLDEWS